MSRLTILTVVTAIFIIVVSCEKDNEIHHLSLLNKRWVHSYEETTSAGIEIYRAGNHDDFPISRYRQSFYFYDNNVCEYRVLAPNDAHYVANGSWKYDERTNVMRIFNSDSVILYEFKVVELTTSVLKLKAAN